MHSGKPSASDAFANAMANDAFMNAWSNDAFARRHGAVLGARCPGKRSDGQGNGRDRDRSAGNGVGKGRRRSELRRRPTFVTSATGED